MHLFDFHFRWRIFIFFLSVFITFCFFLFIFSRWFDARNKKKIITGFVVVIRKTVLQLNYYYLEKPNEKAGAAVVVAAGLLPEEKANNPPLEGGLVVELVLDALNENVDGAFVSDSLLAEAPKEKVGADEEVVVAGVELANENVEGGLAGVDPLPK